VPGAVTAFSADQLSKQAIPDITALTDTLPEHHPEGVARTNTTLTAFIRGVGQQDPVAGYEQGVGIYLDDIYLARPQGALTDIYDLERIEVLRGPQGTLYGRNTIGGAVKYVTRKLATAAHPRPQGHRSATTRRTWCQGQHPDQRPAARRRHRGGVQARRLWPQPVQRRPNYDKDLKAARASVEWSPTPDLFVRLAGDITQDDSHPKNGHRLIVGPWHQPRRS
jgi:iron complex outermembrane receptor protein